MSGTTMSTNQGPQAEEYSAEAASAIKTIMDAFRAGEITEQECKELVKDVFDVKHIEEATDDLNLRSDIYTSMKTLYTATKLILPFI